VAASCRIVRYQFVPKAPDARPAEYPQMIDSIFQKLPFNGDVAENETALEYAFSLFENDRATFDKYLGPIAKTAMKVLVDEKCVDEIKLEFRQKVALFTKSVLATHAEGLLKEMHDQMSDLEKEELKKMTS